MRNFGGRRLMTIYVAVALLVAFIALGTFVQVPYVALGPGPTVNTLGDAPAPDPDADTKRVVEVVGAVDPTPDGHLNLTTVSLMDGLSLFQAIGKWLSPSYELQPRDLYYPPEKSDDDVRKENQAQMSGSEDNATRAAFNFLKQPTAVGISAVADKSPAKGVLKTNDRIVAVDRTPVTTIEGFSAVLAKKQPGDTVELTFLRDGKRQDAPVQLAARPGDAKRPYLGVSMRSVPADPGKDVKFNVGDIGGPSAGLMLTLSIIDQMTPGSLTHGTFIAGTGTIDPDGKVGPIGGVDHKIRAAKDAGATVFLVPAENCALATSDAPDGIELVKVETLTGAVDALATEANRPRC